MSEEIIYSKEGDTLDLIVYMKYSRVHGYLEKVLAHPSNSHINTLTHTDFRNFTLKPNTKVLLPNIRSIEKIGLSVGVLD